VLGAELRMRRPLRSGGVSTIVMVRRRDGGVESKRAASAARPLLAWATVVGAGALLVEVVNFQHTGVGIASPPLRAWFAPMLGPETLVPATMGLVIITLTPHATVRLAWRPLIGAAIAATAAWAVALSSVRGVDRLVAPVRDPNEYRVVAQHVHSVGAFVAGFVGRTPGYPVHVAGHPPGPVLVEWALVELGLGSTWWVAATFILGGAGAVGAVLVAAREVAGEAWARRAAPFLVLAPAAIWVATSADALLAGVAAWGSALIILATGRSDRRGDVAALGGGLLLGWTAFSSYGLILIAVIPLVVALRRRQVRPLVLAALASTTVGVAFALAGFSWIAGLAATRARYLIGISQRRPYVVFLIANLSALAVVVGPATAVAFRRLRTGGLWLLVGGALAAVALADLSGMSKGEVERIWLPFVPWLLVAGAALTERDDERIPWSRSLLPSSAGAWLALQAGTAIAIEALVRTPW
jgi:methylthioxylose transferase